MDDAVRSVLAAYDARREEEFALFQRLKPEEIRARSDQFLMSVGADAGAFLNSLVRHGRLSRILEVGTSFGHSTVYLAEAARAIGGSVVSCDLSAEKQRYARDMLRRAGLEDQVEFKAGDAAEIIAALDGPFDFVLLDARTANYVKFFDLFLPRLAPGAFVAADNIIAPRTPEAEVYRQHVRGTGRFESVLIPIEQGIELSRLVGPATRDGEPGPGGT